MCTPNGVQSGIAMVYYSYLIQVIGYVAMSYMLSADSSLPGTSPKLLDRVRDRIRRKGYAKRTEQSYAHWIKRYILFHGKQRPRDMWARYVAAFLTDMAVSWKAPVLTRTQGGKPSGSTLSHSP